MFFFSRTAREFFKDFFQEFSLKFLEFVRISTRIILPKEFFRELLQELIFCFFRRYSKHFFLSDHPLTHHQLGANALLWKGYSKDVPKHCFNILSNISPEFFQDLSINVSKDFSRSLFKDFSRFF